MSEAESTSVLDQATPVDEVATCEAEVIEAHEPDHVADAIKALGIARKRATDTAEMKYRETVLAVVAGECPRGGDIAKAIDAVGKTDADFESDCRRHVQRVEWRRQIDAHPRDAALRSDIERELMQSADVALHTARCEAEREQARLGEKIGQLHQDIEREKGVIESFRRNFSIHADMHPDNREQLKNDLAARESRIVELTAKLDELIQARDAAIAKEKAIAAQMLEV